MLKLWKKKKKKKKNNVNGRVIKTPVSMLNIFLLFLSFFQFDSSPLQYIQYKIFSQCLYHRNLCSVEVRP